MSKNISQNFPIILAQRAAYIRTITFLQPDEVTPVDLTGYTADMQFRQTVGSTGNPLIEVSTSLGTIVINGPAGTITFTITSSMTDLPDLTQMVYDLFIYSPTGIPTRLLHGLACISGSATI